MNKKIQLLIIFTILSIFVFVTYGYSDVQNIKNQNTDPEWVGTYTPDIEEFVTQMVEAFGMSMDDVSEEQLSEMRTSMEEQMFIIELKSDFTFVMKTGDVVSAEGIMIDKGNNEFELSANGEEEILTIKIEENKFTIDFDGISMVFYKVNG